MYKSQILVLGQGAVGTKKLPGSKLYLCSNIIYLSNSNSIANIKGQRQNSQWVNEISNLIY